MPTKKQKLMPNLSELKPLMRALWQDAYEMKTGFEALTNEELEGQFGRYSVLMNRVSNVIAQLKALEKTLKGKEE